MLGWGAALLTLAPSQARPPVLFGGETRCRSVGREAVGVFWPEPAPLPETCPPPSCVLGREVGVDFWRAVLHFLHIPESPFALEALIHWQRVMDSPYCWNPLITTRQVLGWKCPSWNAAQHYANPLMGILATVETLEQPIYAAILRMLHQEAFETGRLERAVSFWTTGYFQRCDKACRDIVMGWNRLWQAHGISELCPPLTCVPGYAVGPEFYAQVLEEADIPVTQFAIRALWVWAQKEKTGACWNPLATIWEVPGRSCDYNRVGVKNYMSEADGVHATARTLRLERFDALRRFLTMEAWDEEELPRAVGIFVLGSPHGCYMNPYCEDLFARWRVLWEHRDVLDFHPLNPPQTFVPVP